MYSKISGRKEFLNHCLYETAPGVFPICQQTLEGLLKTIGISHDTPLLKYFSQEKLP